MTAKDTPMSETLIKKLKMDKFEQISLLRDAKEFSPFAGFSTIQGPADLVIAYVYSLEEMKELIESQFQAKQLTVGGQLFFLYPKMTNKLGHTPIGRDDIFPFLKVDENGYVPGTKMKFNRMLALDQNYTLLGLKLTDKIEVPSANKPSQKVADYVSHIPNIKAYLQAHPDQLAFFEELTPGYQRGWARYIYSAKTSITQEKRQAEMIAILKAGFKSKELYQASQK